MSPDEVARREAEVRALLDANLTMEQIAEALGVTYGAAYLRVRRVCRKDGVRLPPLRSDVRTGARENAERGDFLKDMRTECEDYLGAAFVRDLLAEDAEFAEDTGLPLEDGVTLAKLYAAVQLRRMDAEDMLERVRTRERQIQRARLVGLMSETREVG